MYALNLGTAGRVLSVTLDQYAPPEQPRVDHLPDGDITDYCYVGKMFVYNPIPKPPDPKPTVTAKMMPGEYFTVGNDIYQATTTIPAGDAVVPGTNCVVVNMADALNELK